MSSDYLEYYGVKHGLGSRSGRTQRQRRNSQDSEEGKNMSRSFKKFNTPQDRTLWQIFWSQDQESDAEDQQMTMVDASIGQRAKSRMDRDQNEIEDESDEEVVYESKGGETYPPPKPKRTPQKPFNENEWTSMDLGEAQEREFTGRGLLERKDSDTDLMLGAPPKGQWCARVRWCFVNCRNPVFWRVYWWIPLVILLAIAIYIVVTLVIVKTL